MAICTWLCCFCSGAISIIVFITLALLNVIEQAFGFVMAGTLGLLFLALGKLSLLNASRKDLFLMVKNLYTLAYLRVKKA